VWRHEEAFFSSSSSLALACNNNNNKFKWDDAADGRLISTRS